MDRRRTDGRANGQKNNVTLAHPYHKGKFSLITPIGLEGDSVTEGRRYGRPDGGVPNIPTVLFFKREDNELHKEKVYRLCDMNSTGPV